MTLAELAETVLAASEPDDPARALAERVLGILALPPPERDPQIDGDIIETWADIAMALRKSVNWCKMLAVRADDPLPVMREDGVAVARRTEIIEWHRRNIGGRPRRRYRCVVCRKPGHTARNCPDKKE